MIKDPEAYRRLSEKARWDALRRMTPEESIALGEALLTSELMDLVAPPRRDRPLSLAVALGIPPQLPKERGRSDA
jgi:hypothetical protein